MSAWLVNKQHIDVIVTAGIALDMIHQEHARSAGEMLWLENAASLCARYQDAETAWDLPKRGEYVFTPAPVEDLACVLKQLDCYEYQACEHPAWSVSAAQELTERLQVAVAERIGNDPRSTPGYENAVWGVDVDDDGKLLLTMDEWRAWLNKTRDLAPA